MTSFPLAGVFFFTHISVNAGCTADAQDIMVTGLYDGIVWNTPPALVGHFLLSKIGRIIVITANKQNPVVCFLEPFGDLVIDGLIVPGFIKSEAAVAGNNKKGVRASVLNTQFIDNTLEVPVNITRNNNLFCVRIFENFIHSRT